MKVKLKVIVRYKYALLDLRSIRVQRLILFCGKKIRLGV